MAIQTTAPDAQVPLNDGAPFPYVMGLEDRNVYAQSVTELVEALIDGYSDALLAPDAETQTLLLRWETAVEAANAIQPLFTAAATNDGSFDPHKADEDLLTLVLGNRRYTQEIDTYNGPV